MSMNWCIGLICALVIVVCSGGQAITQEQTPVPVPPPVDSPPYCQAARRSRRSPSAGWGPSVNVTTLSVLPKLARGNRVPSPQVRGRIHFKRERTMWGFVVFAGLEHRRAGRTLLRLAVLALVAWLILGVGHSNAASPLPPQRAEGWPVEVVFRKAVELWADERFDALWACGLLASRYQMSREVFTRWMRHRVVKPTCCWGQLRDVRIHFQGAEEAIVEAQVGVDVKTLGTTLVRSMFVYLRREEGEWRVLLEDFLTKPEDGLGWLR